MKISRIAIVAALIAVALSLPFYGPVWNRLMHLLGAILFMGNIVVTVVWMSLARRSGDGGALRLAARGVALTDVIFTLPGALLLLLNGGILGTPYFKVGEPWLIVSLVLFVLSGVLWLSVLVPIQKRLLRVAVGSGDNVAESEQLIRDWFRWGGLVTLMPLVSLVLMVYKPTLW